jgi:flagellar protein FliO/FliZ
MLEYILRLFILVPMVGALAWGSLWMWKRVQAGLPQAGNSSQPVRVTGSLSLGTSGKLAVVEFAGRELLVAVSRNGISLIADAHDGDFHA